MSAAGTATAPGGALPAGRGRRTAALLAAVWAAAIAGAVIGVTALTGDDAVAPPPDRSTASAREATPPPGGAYGLGDRIRTSFGVASVGSVVRVTGPGYAMGLELRPGDRVFQAQLTLVNMNRGPVVYDPGLVTAAPRKDVGAFVIATGSARGGRIDGLSAHRYAVRFALAPGAELPRLRLGDPAGGKAALVALGSTRGLETLDLAEHHPVPRSPTGGR